MWGDKCGGQYGTVAKEQGYRDLVSEYGAQGTDLRPRYVGTERAQTKLLFYSKLQRQTILSFIYPIYNHKWRNISTIYVYNKTSIKRNILRGADKSLARPGRKQATAADDFDFHISYL